VKAAEYGSVVRRDELLNRLGRVRPQIIALIAPAGFGKSTLARQLIEHEEAFAVCECANLADDLDFIRRIVPALAIEDPERGATLSQCELLLGDGMMSRGERIEVALNAWRAVPRLPATFVFDDAEYIAMTPSARELFTRLLAVRPEKRTIIICSRESVRVHLSRFAPPHKVITLRADDLAFSSQELQMVLAPLKLESATLETISKISQGWPVPALFMARVAADGRDPALLERLGDVAFEHLYEYLADQVLGGLSSALAEALFACACIPNATIQDLTTALGDIATIRLLLEFGRTSPFVRATTDGTLIVHPLMRAMLVENAGHRRSSLLKNTAEQCERRGDYLRAAELYLACPDQEAAASSLENVPVGDDRAPSMRYSQLVASMDRTVVNRHPTLWACSALLQTFSADTRHLLDETATLWATLSPEVPQHKRYYVLATRILLLTYLGMFSEAMMLLDSVAPRSAIPEMPTTREHGFALYLRATLNGRLGRIEEAEADLVRAWPLIESMDIMASAALMIRATDVERPRGNRFQERELLERSLIYARRSQMANFVAFRLAEATFGAWLAGEADVERFSKELEEVANSSGIRSFRFFSGCARGFYDQQPAQFDLTRWVICGHLIAACEVRDKREARAHAAAASALTRNYEVPYLQTLSAAILAELSEDQERAGHYERAMSLARLSNSPPLEASVAAAFRRAGDAGVLQPIVQRLRSHAHPRTPKLEISVLLGEVRLGGRQVDLADRQLELLLLTAVHRRISAQKVGELLWPGLDEEQTRKSLKVLLYRLRQRLGDEGAIIRTRDGLELRADASVDTWEIQRQTTGRRAHEIVDDADYNLVLSLCERLTSQRQRRMLAWEWFDSLDRTLRELGSQLAGQLARYALMTGRSDDALRLAEEMIRHDACDESAREIAIMTYLARGERGAALKHYRQYRDVLSAELSCEPSRSLTALIQV
jgi:DNA-binding SARP family transcriptional activator